MSSQVGVINSKTAIQAVKKGAAKSGSPTQDGQGEKVVKSSWQPRNDQSMAKRFLIATIQVSLCPYPIFTRNQHKTHLNCCY